MILQTMKQLIIAVLFLICLSCNNEIIPDDTGSQNIPSDYRNFYGIVWVGNNDDNLAYARQMGYDYVFYRYGMEKHPDSDSLKFYLESPQFNCYQHIIDRSTTYTEKKKESISRFAALKDASLPFPENLARGWFFTPAKFAAEPDFQQQAVIDFLVDSILNKVASIERKEKGFEFGGFAWDVPQLTGDFWDTIQTYEGKRLGSQVTLKYWTGYDGSDKHPDVTHEYKTHSDGRAAFYKTLWKKTRQKYPDARFMVEPWHPYNEYIKHIEKRTDVMELLPDLIVQEKGGIDFATDKNIENSIHNGWIDYTRLGSTSPNIFKEEDNRKVAGTAASLGSVFSWFGRFGGTGDMPAYQSIREVPARLQLVRVIPNWENLHRTPLAERTWDGETYASPKAFISKDIIYAIQPRTNKLFVVFLKANVSVEIPDSHLFANVYGTNNIFRENSDTSSDIRINGNKITLTNASNIEKGYILK